MVLGVSDGDVFVHTGNCHLEAPLVSCHEASVVRKTRTIEDRETNGCVQVRWKWQCT